MIALILAGGSGTRFWPLSTDKLQKQFLTLFDNKSMLKLTYERLLSFLPKENIFVVTTYDQVPLVYDYLPELNVCQLIVEPCGMNTGPCIALSIAYLLWNYNREERVLVLPADHYIPDTEMFKEYINKADELAKDNILITFGIKPTYPATGYGYIEQGEKITDGMFHVKQFKEKPNFELAKIFLEHGNYLWNSGIFCFSIFSIIQSFEKYCKSLFEKVVEVSCINDIKIKKQKYSEIQKLSIDIEIFEKADNVAVIPVDFIWSDVGNWSSLHDLMVKDENNNYFTNSSFSLNSKNNYIKSNKFVALIGIENLIFVETDDSILICNKNDAELVKEIKIPQ